MPHFLLVNTVKAEFEMLKYDSRERLDHNSRIPPYLMGNGSRNEDAGCQTGSAKL
jgi:hypothetical protein